MNSLKEKLEENGRLGSSKPYFSMEITKQKNHPETVWPNFIGALKKSWRSTATKTKQMPNFKKVIFKTVGNFMAF